jgi:hypothetical protein
MLRPLGSVALRLALCALALGLAWRFIGPIGLVMTAPLIGIALARPLIELAGGVYRALRSHAWRDVQGRYYAYRGTPVQVLEDAAHGRWVRAADVRAIVGLDTSDHALALTYGPHWRRLGADGEPHFAAEALLVHLQREPRPEAQRFRRWVERDIAYPARRARRRYGIREEAVAAGAARDGPGKTDD